MRRFFSVLVLALFVAAPVVQVRCAMACATEEAADSANDCHREQATAPEGTPSLASHHDCGKHAVSTAVGLTNRALTLDALPGASDLPVSLSLTPLVAASSRVAASPGGPPGGLLVPLRV